VDQHGVTRYLDGSVCYRFYIKAVPAPLPSSFFPSSFIIHRTFIFASFNLNTNLDSNHFFHKQHHHHHACADEQVGRCPRPERQRKSIPLHPPQPLTHESNKTDISPAQAGPGGDKDFTLRAQAAGDKNTNKAAASGGAGGQGKAGGACGSGCDHSHGDKK